MNQQLTQTTIEAIEKLDRIEKEERAIYEASETVKLFNGKVLNKEEQLKLFKVIYEKSIANNACSLVKKFKISYELGDFYRAWQLILGSFDWLSNVDVLNADFLPKTITVGVEVFYSTDDVSIKFLSKHGRKHGEFVDYFKNGAVHQLMIFDCEVVIYREYYKYLD